MYDRNEMLPLVAGLFREHGYPSITMRGIARALDMREAQLRSYFTLKDDLLWEIVSRTAQLFLLQASLIPLTLPPDEQLRLLVQKHLEVIVHESDYMTVFNRDWSHLSRERQHEIRQRREQYEERFTRIIDAGQQQGLFSVADVHEATAVVLATLHWYCPCCWSIETADNERFFQQYQIMVTRMLMAHSV
ncbi:MAG TPA: TetR/AcrR family transcriptional regulator [Dictyobacter sp.]|jgi:AcrR family transcriptional regulator|nr:TetR/AcrR family transcriptional regulator [Dictyobacter sp.]